MLSINLMLNLKTLLFSIKMIINKMKLNIKLLTLEKTKILLYVYLTLIDL